MGRVAVAGGGITGLTAALRLADAGHDVVVVERDDRFGGKIRTSPFAGLAAVDEGPDAFLARVPWGLELCRELGLGDQLVSPASGKAYIWWDGALHPIPDGLVLGVPAGLTRLARSHLLSWHGKLRAAAEPLLPKSFKTATADADDLGALVRRRFGAEVLVRLVDPLIGGINAGDADHLSLAASAPQIGDVATANRSLLVGLRRAAPRRDPSAPVFLAPRTGMSTIVDALVDHLCARGVELRSGVDVGRVEPSGDRWDVDPVGLVDAVVLATPAHVTAGIVRTVAPAAAELVGAIEHASVAMVTLAFDDGAFGRVLDGSGHLVPKPQQRSITAASWASTKWAHLASAGQVVLRVSLGRYGAAEVLGRDDDGLVRAACADLGTQLGLRADPLAARVTRWDQAFPQYLPGHLDRVAAIERDVTAHAPGLVLAGAAFRGVGIPACIRQGGEAARQIDVHLSHR
jgi:oxygen-dependent protoporphyrinogen oxidase